MISREWMINAAILLVVAALLVLAGVQRFTVDPVGGIAPLSGVADSQTTPTLAVADGASTETQAAAPEAAYPLIGTTNPFRELVTPTPAPPPPTPAPTPTPSLERAVQGWIFKYPIRDKFVFQDEKGQEHTLTTGQPYQLMDGRLSLEAVPEQSGKWGVVLKYGDQQKQFSLIQ